MNNATHAGPWSHIDALKRQARDLKSSLDAAGFDLLPSNNSEWVAKNRSRSAEVFRHRLPAGLLALVSAFRLANPTKKKGHAR